MIEFKTYKKLSKHKVLRFCDKLPIHKQKRSKMSVMPDEKVHFSSEQIAAIEEAFAYFDFNNGEFIIKLLI